MSRQTKNHRCILLLLLRSFWGATASSESVALLVSVIVCNFATVINPCV